MPKPTDKHEPTPLWRNPAVVGPTVGALIAAAVAIPQFLPERDRTPPRRPTIAKIERETSDENQTTIVVRYEDALDNSNGSGLKEVRLWYRHNENTPWKQTEVAKTGRTGELKLGGLIEPGNYYFDLVATDQRGNQSPSPQDTDGQQEYFLRAEQSVATSTPVAILDAAEVNLEQFRERNPNFAEMVGLINIPVQFHVIHDGEEGNVSDERIHQQVAVLNRAFFPGKIAFTLAGITRTDNPKWYSMGSASQEERDAKEALQVKPESNLNIYTVAPPGGLLSWSAFPWQLAEEPGIDGIVVLHSTLPGSNSAPFNLGHNAVHGVGHWLGLYHTFQGGCDGMGDRVDDTVAHATPNFGNPNVGERNGACKEGEAAPVQNYMNYVDDDSMTRFTPGQFKRMKAMSALYRPRLLSSEQRALADLQ